MIVAENLEEEGRQCDQGCVDPVVGLAHLLKHDLSDDLGREDICVEERWVKDQGTEQAPELM